MTGKKVREGVKQFLQVDIACIFPKGEIMHVHACFTSPKDDVIINYLNATPERYRPDKDGTGAYSRGDGDSIVAFLILVRGRLLSGKIGDYFASSDFRESDGEESGKDSLVSSVREWFIDNPAARALLLETTGRKYPVIKSFSPDDSVTRAVMNGMIPW